MTVSGLILTIFCIFDLFSTVFLIESGLATEANPLLDYALGFGMEYMVATKIILNWICIINLETFFKKGYKGTNFLIVTSVLLIYVALISLNFF